MIEFHGQLPGYRPTPLHELPDVAEELGVGAVHLKDESERLGLPAFKILGVTWAVERALRCHPATHTLVAASAGNHGRAVARAAAQRHLASRIYLPARTSIARADAIRSEDAEVVSVDGDYDHAVAVAERAAFESGTVVIADVSRDTDAQIPAWVVDGYATLFQEVVDQLDEAADLFIVPIGVGSLAAACVRFVAYAKPDARVVGVEPATAACVTASLQAGLPVTVPTPGTIMAGLDCATPSAGAWPVLREGLAGTVTIEDAEAIGAARKLAARGLVVGESGAATVAALRGLASDERRRPLRDAIGLGPSSRVVCVATEGVTGR